MDNPFLEFRDLFPAYHEGIYANHAAVSPFSTLTREALQTYWEDRAHFPVDVYPDIMDVKDHLKTQIAQLIRAESADQIVMMPNTGTGLNAIATGLQWKPGDRIILFKNEFPTNIYPFLNLERQGVIIDWIEPENFQIIPEMIRNQIQPSTRMLAISFVQFLTGFRADLEAIGRLCHDHNVLFIVDGIQGTGVCPVDVQKWHVDGWACGGHKWLMWPMGTGFLYVSPNLLELLQPAYAGWLSVKDNWNLLDYNLEFHDTAEKFAVGSMNFLGVSVADKLLIHMLQLGISNIQNRIIQLTEQLIHGLKNTDNTLVTPDDVTSRAGIVSIQHTDPESVQKHLQEKNIIAAARGPILRFSPHCTNTVEEMDRIVEGLKVLQ